METSNGLRLFKATSLSLLPPPTSSVLLFRLRPLCISLFVPQTLNFPFSFIAISNLVSSSFRSVMLFSCILVCSGISVSIMIMYRSLFGFRFWVLGFDYCSCILVYGIWFFLFSNPSLPMNGFLGNVSFLCLRFLCKLLV